MQTTGLKGFRLSQQQARLWALQGSQTTYRTQCSVLLEGDLDANVLQDALGEVVARHGVLRTWFYRAAGMEVPVQVIAKAAEVACLCPLTSLLGASEEQQAEHIAAYFHAMQQEPLAVEQQELLLRTRLLQMGERRHRLLLSIPALCADAASLPCLLAEISQAYTAYLTAGQGVNTPLPLQYTDVSTWQNEIFQEEDAASERKYWQQFDLSGLVAQVAPFAHLTPIPAEEPAANIAPPFAPQIIDIPLSPALLRWMDDLTQTQSIAPEVVLLACWQVFLWRLGLPSPVLLGVARDGRHYDELQQALGLYTRLVPLHTSLVATTSFQRLLTQVQDNLHEATEKQLYFNWLPGARASASSAAFFPLTFTFESWPAHWTAGPLTLTLEQRRSYQEPFLLQLTGVQQGERLHLELHYDPQQVQPAVVARLAQGMEALLAAALHEPEAPISNLPLLPEAERQHLLSTFAQTLAWVSPLQLHQLFEAQTLLRPDALAVVCEPQSLTYQHLNAQANQVAHALRRQGVGPGTVVGLCVERSPFMLVGMLAILKAGAAYVPLEPEHPQARLAHQLQQAQAPLVLTQESLRARLAWLAVPLWSLDGATTLWQHEPVSNLPLRSCGQDLAYIIYTSGSTGLPKGVMISQENVSNYTQAICAQLSCQADWRFATVSTLAADLGNTPIFASLASGGCLHILSYETLTSADALGTAMQQQAIEVLKIVPSHLSALLAASGSRGQTLLPSRCLVLGGESFTKSLWEQLCNLEGECAVFNHYGPTESTIGALVYPVGRLGDNARTRPSLPEATMPIGRPLPNVQAYVLDKQQQLVPVGIGGELYLGGSGLAVGYLLEPEQTAARFVPNPFGTERGARLYRTGDLAYCTEEGQIRFLGRGDSQVKLRGHRIELGEIEAVLRRQPQVWDARVVLWEQATGEAQLVGYVVSKEPEGINLEQVRTALQEQLPTVMVPTKIMVLERWPLTPNGKVDRAALPKPDQQAEQEERWIADARSPIEHILVELWSQVLGVKTVGIHDNFFELGGHSLLATQVIAQLMALVGVEVPILWLFETPTVAALAGRVERALRREQGEGLPLPLVPVSRAEPLPLSFAQQRLWFLEQLAPGQLSYNKAVVMRLHGTLKVTALTSSLEEIVRRHEVLRTTYKMHADQPVQVIHPAGELSFPLVDVRGLGEGWKTEVRRLVAQDGMQPFDLERGPVIRASLVQRSDNEHVLLLSMHHIVSDDWSNSIILRELSTLYQRNTTGKGATLPELPIQYGDYAVWQRQWLEGHELQRQLTYWERRLRGSSALELLGDHPRQHTRRERGAHQGCKISAEQTQQLQELSQQAGVTLFMTLLAAFQVLLSRYTGQTNISVGTPIANRSRAEIEGLIGFFVNTLVLRADLSDNPTFLDLLEQVREICLGAYAHQDVPFEKLVETLQPERDLSRSPLFQVMLSLQHTAEPEVELQDIALSSMPQETATAKFDLSMFVAQSKQGLYCGIEYNTDLFEPATIARLLEHWQTLLAAIVSDPQQTVMALPLLGEAERRRLLVDWNDTQVDNLTQSCLHQLVEEQAARTPEALALVFKQQQLSYGALDRRATHVAHILQQQGVGPDTLVGIAMERSLELVVGLLAILKAGGAYVPLDPDYPQERIAWMLADSQVSILLTQRFLVERLPTAGRVVLCLDGDGSVDLPPAQKSEPSCDVPLLPEHLAYMIYTSGSTGKPKGVMNTHQAIINRLRWMQDTRPLSTTDRVLQKTPSSFDVSVWEFFWPLISGACLVIAEPGGHRESRYLARLIGEQAISTVHFVPSMLRWFLQESELPRKSSLQRVICSGEALTHDLQESVFARLDVSLENLYGPTEAAVEVTSWTCERGGARETVPIGQPISNIQVYLLDELQQPVPIGVPGEVYLGGIGLARGYWQRGDITAEKFIPDGVSGAVGRRLYRTGDLGRYAPDGNIEYLGRRDQQVKLRGYRIELGEIEAIVGQYAGVKASVVTLRQETGESRLVAYVVTEEPEAVSENELRQYLRKHVPEYMVPSWFVFLETLPLTPSGKVDRRTLPAPTQINREQEKAFVAPRTPAEEVVAGIWAEVLKVERVGIYDNFFDIGGHSLLAVQIISRLSLVFHLELPLRCLFEKPIINDLIDEIAHRSGDRATLEEIAQMFQEIEQLTEEEVANLLAR